MRRLLQTGKKTLVVSDVLIRRSADDASRLLEKSAKLSLDIERQVATRDGPLCYLLAMGHQEAVEALVELAGIDPTETEKIRALQNKVTLYSNIGDWLSNAVAMGHQAYRDLDNPDIIEEWVAEFSARDEG